jgi:hypothetical protein
MVITAIIYEFFMLGANAPAVLGLFTLGYCGDQLIARFDDGTDAVGNGFCAHGGGLEMSRRYCQ